MKKIFLLLCVIGGCMLASCGGGGGSDDDGGGGGASTEYVSITPNATLLADGETQTIKVTASGEWRISNSSDWLTVSPMSGTGAMSISLSAGRNATNAPRTTVIEVACGSRKAQCTVTQDAATLAETMTISTSELQFSVEGGTRTFSITSNTDWTISKPDWCVISSESGSNNGDISVTVEENNTGATRSGDITVRGKTKSASVNVSQPGGSLGTISSFANSGAAFTFSYTSEISIMETGICYSTTKTMPTTDDDKVQAEVSSKTGFLSLELPSPAKNVTYYVRAYITNAVGTAYSTGEAIQYKYVSGKPEEGDNPTPAMVKRK